ncbi:MAG TPA: sugar ABC transporter permease [Caldilineaceae bacterium]|nr:sugar ABC transporter permease [Caldilineaceae bacterium]
MSTATAHQPKAPLWFTRWRRNARRTSGWAGMLYVLPALVILMVFEFWPIFFNIYISLWRWDVGPLNFVGLGNYRRLLLEGFITRDYNNELAVGEVLHSLIITIYYAVGRVPVTIALAFVLAYLLFVWVKRGRVILRTAYFLPYVTNSAAIALVFAWIFDARIGVMNALLERLGLPTLTWLNDPFPMTKRLIEMATGGMPESWANLAAGPSVAMVVIIIYSVWTSLGYNIVIYLAGLTSIPNELIEAARMDGANDWVILRRVIWPLVTPVTFFLLIANTIGAFQAFDPIYVLTRDLGFGRGGAGGPLETTLTVTVYIFRNFYERANAVGYAAAVALFLFLIILGLTVIQFRLFSKRVHYQ